MKLKKVIFMQDDKKINVSKTTISPGNISKLKRSFRHRCESLCSCILLLANLFQTNYQRTFILLFFIPFSNKKILNLFAILKFEEVQSKKNWFSLFWYTLAKVTKGGLIKQGWGGIFEKKNWWKSKNVG